MKTQRQSNLAAAFVAVTVALLATPALAEDCPELAGRWPYGPAYSVEASGHHAYFGSGTALIVADVTDLTAPRTVGRITLPGIVQDIEVSGAHAFVAAEAAGLWVIDVHVPSAPVEVASADTPGSALGVAVAGGYAYVADDFSGLRVFDVRTPSAPAEVGFFDTQSEAVDVSVSDGYAFVADWDDGLRVVDVRSPSAPVEVGFVHTPDYAAEVAVANGYAYLADGGSGLLVIDVRSPTDPVQLGAVDTPGFAYGIAVSGVTAAVADWQGGLRVIDVSTPSAPVEVGSVYALSPAWSVALSADHAYVAAAEAGLRVVDLSMPSDPMEVGFVDAPGYAADVVVSRGYAYVADSLEGLRVLDVSAPTAPVEVGFAPTPGSNVATSGGYLYVANGDSGLRIVDVSMPSAPAEVGHLDTPGFASGIAVSGAYACVADWYDFRIIDVSTPSAPVEVAVVDTPGLDVGVAVSGSYAYVANYLDGLRVFNISTPAAPVEVGAVDTPGTARDVTVSRGFAYVADAGGGLRVIDVRDPSAPIEVGSVGTPYATMSVAVSGSYAYVADDQAGLRAIDISSPSSPSVVGSFDTPGTSGGAAASAGHVYLADGGAGLAVFRVCDGGPAFSHDSFIPAAAFAAGAEGAFFQTDVEINNRGDLEAEAYFEWLPRGHDNSAPIRSASFSLRPGESRRFENALATLFELGPDSLGALRLVASTESVIGMSRTYNIPAGGAIGTFGQGLPAIRATEMLAGTEPQRITFLSESADFRSNVGCVNGTSEPARINIRVFDDQGSVLGTRTMDLAPFSNQQINRVFGGWTPVNGYADVWADSNDAVYYCYGSVLDNRTSDPATILPQAPLAGPTFIPAAALAAGLEGSFFETDLDLNNAGRRDISYELLWLPRGADNSDPVHSRTFSLAPGSGVRYTNVLDSVFGLEPDQVGALAIEASGPDFLAMSTTYNLPPVVTAGTFGQGLPAVRGTVLIGPGVKRRIIFMNENADLRSNVGCQNGSSQAARVFLELFDSEGESLEVKTMDLKPLSNNQLTRLFRDHAPISAGYVDVWTNAPGASIYCYGSVLDNSTSDPTTVLPQ
jgi:hypothetical protein